jgi:hypothetical protein
METTIAPVDTTRTEQDTFRAISITALFTGTLQFIGSIVQHYLLPGQKLSFGSFLLEGGPARLLKHIASTVFGPEAENGGTLMITWGAVFHYTVSFLLCTIFFLLYPRLSRILKYNFVIALIYGMVWWLLINYCIIPVSRLHESPVSLPSAVIDILFNIATFSLPLALIAGRFHSHRQ